jgi:hypothetical protein
MDADVALELAMYRPFGAGSQVNEPRHYQFAMFAIALLRKTGNSGFRGLCQSIVKSCLSLHFVVCFVCLLFSLVLVCYVLFCFVILCFCF